MDSLAKIKRICSHPQSLAQCRGWLDEHLPDVPRIPSFLFVMFNGFLALVALAALLSLWFGRTGGD